MRNKWTTTDYDQYKMLRRLQVATLIGLAFILVYSCRFLPSRSFLSILGVGIVSAGAFLLAGFVLGFIFCIPRTPGDSGDSSSKLPAGGSQGATNRTAGRDNGGVTSNSNLVEVSDWLTKIIVGVGLVELNKIPGKVRGLTAYIGNGLRDCDTAACAQNSEALALGIVIFFSAAGFLIGYLWSRLYFQKALNDLERASQVNSAWQYADAAGQAYKDGDLEKANEMTDLAIASDASNAKAHMFKGAILKRFAQKSGKPGDKALLQQALAQATEAASLDPSMGGAFYNVACYQALLGADTADILKNLARAFQIDPKLKKIAPEDDDLVSVRNDADFRNLLV